MSDATITFLIVFSFTVLFLLFAIIGIYLTESAKQANTRKEKIRVHRKGRAKRLFCREDKNTEPYLVFHLVSEEADLESLTGYRKASTEEAFATAKIGGLYNATFRRDNCGWRVEELSAI
ncbi:MAG: hypothetical protein R3251_00680 [Candidatus Spechtbacterales bacterium]|nr:hypothetical protein [Candidatus Spechtbacterales bacterium]